MIVPIILPVYNSGFHHYSYEPNYFERKKALKKEKLRKKAEAEKAEAKRLAQEKVTQECEDFTFFYNKEV